MQNIKVIVAENKKEKQESTLPYFAKSHDTGTIIFVTEERNGCLSGWEVKNPASARKPFTHFYDNCLIKKYFSLFEGKITIEIS